MKKLVLVLAIVFAFGVTFALNVPVQTEKANTEIVSSVKSDEKDKKEAKSEKKEGSSEKSAEAKKACCSEKKACDEKKAE